MKKFAVILFALTISICYAQTKPKGLAAQLTDTWVRQWSTHDSTGVINSLAPKVVLGGDTSYVKGKAGVASWMREEMKVTGKLKITTVQSSEGSDIAYSAGHWSIEHKQKDGTEGVWTGSHILIWKKSGTAWKLAVVFITSDPGKR